MEETLTLVPISVAKEFSIVLNWAKTPKGKYTQTNISLGRKHAVMFLAFAECYQLHFYFVRGIHMGKIENPNKSANVTSNRSGYNGYSK